MDGRSFMAVLWSRYAWPEKLHPNHQSNELVYLLCCHRGISPPGDATNLGKEGTGQSTNTIAISHHFTVQQMITTIGGISRFFLLVEEEELQQVTMAQIAVLGKLKRSYYLQGVSCTHLVGNILMPFVFRQTDGSRAHGYKWIASQSVRLSAC